MIKVEELRIGNLVYIPSTGQIIPVTSINIDLGIVVNRSLRILGFDQVEPVPISEEWLLKFGFTRQPWGLVKSGLLFKDDLNHPCEELTLEVGNGFRVTVKSVHSLQNLVHTLTGEELIIKS
ncbi:hypothetical protein [uncultured Chryseobacterium sp.]|uniref:hypothetical protein n=1 Tax=uncultured Chryseobacterium sp. TaxID=259322 RepID=UPI0025D1EA13|nr:hypothetical protein [uncultured Chryseobacterium sp.]